MKAAIAAALSLAAFTYAFPAGADERFARFDGGIGVIPVSNVASALNPDGTVNVSRNIVRGVNPAGQIWVIDDLRAEVRSDGRIRVDGRGLLLGGGNGIGTATQKVFATFICEVTPFIERSTDLTGVQLEPDGDFRINDELTPWPPNTACASPVLLIRNAAGGGWFAAGIPKR